MTTVENKLSFIKIESKNKQLLKCLCIYALLICMIFPLGISVYYFIKDRDYKTLQGLIENDILQGKDKIYDYKKSNHSKHKIEVLKPGITTEGFGSMLFPELQSCQQIASNRKMLRYSSPDFRVTPFCFISIEKNDEDGYDIKQIIAKGIGYKTESPHPSSPVFDFLTDLDNPNNVYEKAFQYIHENSFSSDPSYYLAKGSYDEIIKLIPPSSYAVSRYDDVHITSKFHSIDFQYKNSTSYGTYCSGGNGTGHIYTDRTETYYLQKDNFIRIIEHPKSKLMEISLSVTTLVFIICLLYMFCGLLPSAKKNLALAGKIWVNTDKTHALAFSYKPFIKHQIRIISTTSDDTYTFKYSYDNTKILLSNNQIYSLKSYKNEEDIACISLIDGDLEVKYYNYDV